MGLSQKISRRIYPPPPKKLQWQKKFVKLQPLKLQCGPFMDARTTFPYKKKWMISISFIRSYSKSQRVERTYQKFQKYGSTGVSVRRATINSDESRLLASEMKGLYSTQPPEKKLLFNKNQKTPWSLVEDLRQSGNFSSNPVLGTQAIFLTSQAQGSSFVKIR